MMTHHRQDQRPESTEELTVRQAYQTTVLNHFINLTTQMYEKKTNAVNHYENRHPTAIFPTHASGHRLCQQQQCTRCFEKNGRYGK